MIVLANRAASHGRFLARFESDAILSRIWAHDPSVWKRNATDIVHRLGWLHAPESMQPHLDRIESLASHVVQDGFQDIVLLGMGGSSLAAETLIRTFAPIAGSPQVRILDTTHPDAIRAIERTLDLKRTLFIVATKSGTTTETLALFRYFHAKLEETGAPSPGRQFIAITDPGSPLVDLATTHGFRDTFLNDPTIGGRYAALTFFGLVPAALGGIPIRTLLQRSREMAIQCAKYGTLEKNPAVQLGIFLGSCAAGGRDKVTFLISPSLRPFGDWVEQLIAESTGKQGTGILPIVDEPVASPAAYGDDRVFVHLRMALEPMADAAEAALRDAGHPIACVTIDSAEAIGELFFLWEMATAIAGYTLGINPFDQPDVEYSKAFTRQMVLDYRSTGTRPPSFAKPASASALVRVLDSLDFGDYVALQAYVPPTPEMAHALRALRVALRSRYGVATTAGYGPRFLHSTGQLHKGDRGNGRFIQFIMDPKEDLEIPPNDTAETAGTLSFGVLIAAQAAGDRQALLGNGRDVATFRIGPDGESALQSIAKHLTEEAN